MKKNIINVFIFLLLSALTIGCHKDNENSSSDEQMQEVLENAQQIMDFVNNYYESAESVSEMALHLNEIKAMENVEDAWQEDNSIALRIKDGGIIEWCFFPTNTSNRKVGTCSSSRNQNAENLHKSLCEAKSACISITVPYDESRLIDSDFVFLNILENDYLESYGYEVSRVNGSDVTPDFICEQMPNYGVNIIVTHGGVDIWGQHWIMTGVEVMKTSAINYLISSLIPAPEWKSDKVRLWCVKERRNAVNVYPVYLAIGESYISEKMSCRFPNNSLLFAWACSTLKGSASFYNVLKSKGLGCYYGYDNMVNAPRATSDLSWVMECLLTKGYNAHEAYEFVGAGETPSLLLFPGNSEVTLVDNSKYYFSVSPTQKVLFSSGNLQYCASTSTWRFAEHQYDYIGEENINCSSTYDGWIDLYCWGTSGWNSGAQNYQPWSSPVLEDGLYPGGSYMNDLTGEYAEADWAWHNAISNGGNQAHIWRTLTNDEWTYLLYSRLNAIDKRGIATVCNYHGLILLPDNWNIPSGLSFVKGFGEWSKNQYSSSEWERMEAAGAIFLPAAGPSSSYGYGQEGNYWSATHSEEFAKSPMFTKNWIEVWGRPRYYKASVRPVKDYND